MEKVSIYKWRDALNIIEIMDYCSLIQYSRGPDHSPKEEAKVAMEKKARFFSGTGAGLAIFQKKRTHL